MDSFHGNEQESDLRVTAAQRELLVTPFRQERFSTVSRPVPSHPSWSATANQKSDGKERKASPFRPPADFPHMNQMLRRLLFAQMLHSYMSVLQHDRLILILLLRLIFWPRWKGRSLAGPARTFQHFLLLSFPSFPSSPPSLHNHLLFISLMSDIITSRAEVSPFGIRAVSTYLSG